MSAGGARTELTRRTGDDGPAWGAELGGPKLRGLPRTPRLSDETGAVGGVGVGATIRLAPILISPSDAGIAESSTARSSFGVRGGEMDDASSTAHELFDGVRRWSGVERTEGSDETLSLCSCPDAGAANDGVWLSSDA